LFVYRNCSNLARWHAAGELPADTPSIPNRKKRRVQRGLTSVFEGMAGPSDGAATSTPPTESEEVNSDWIETPASGVVSDIEADDELSSIVIVSDDGGDTTIGYSENGDDEYGQRDLSPE
jgi:hypothetical protein